MRTSLGKTMEEAYILVEKKHGRLRGKRKPAQYFLGSVYLDLELPSDY